MPDVTIGVNRDIRGGLDTDTDILYLNGGSYPDCVNVERNNSATTGSDTPSLGTRLQYEIPAQSVQNQRIRIYIDTTQYPNGFDWIRVTLYNGNEQVIKNDYINNVGLTNNPTAIRQQILALLAQSGFSNLNYTVFTNQTDPDGNVIIDIEFSFFYDDWVLEIVPEQRIDQTPSFYNANAVIGRRPDDLIQVTSGAKPIVVATALEPFRTRIMYEAISLTGAGKYHLIGSKENNSLLFMTWTTQTKERQRLQLNIVGLNTGTVNNGVVNRGVFVTTDIAHGLQTNESIVLANLSGEANIFNGEWTITVVSDTSFYLNTALPFSAMPQTITNYGGQIYVNPYGLGAFLVQRYDIQANVYRYVIPLRSKKLNWITTKQIDLDVEYFNRVYSLYYNDFYNRPRVTYFEGELYLDSAIEVINPEFGRYSYEELTQQIKLQQDSAGVTIELRDQVQTGGSLNSGSYRYGVVLVTEDFTETEISTLSNLISVYEPIWEGLTGDNVYGTYAATTKINQIFVSGIQPGIYKYIDLISVYISGTSFSLPSTEALVVTRTQLGPDQTEITLQHTGNEIDSRAFPLGGLNPIRQSILKAYNNVIGENRLLISNFETSQRFDISEWVNTFTYSIKKYPLYSDFFSENKLGFATPLGDATGYQLYEWYRFYAVGEFIEGGYTDATFCFDVRFVTQQEYTNSFGTDDDYRFLETNLFDRRDFNGDDLTTYTMGQNTREYYQFGIEIKNIDWTFSINGVKAKDLFKRILIHRAERIKEVIASGAINMGIIYNDPDNQYPDADEVLLDFPGIKVTQPFQPEIDAGGAADQQLLYSLQTGATNSRFCSFYSPTFMFGEQYSFIEGDSVVALGRYSGVHSTELYYGGEFEKYMLRIWRSTLPGGIVSVKSNVVEGKYLIENEEHTFEYNNQTYVYTKKGFILRDIKYFSPTSQQIEQTNVGMGAVQASPVLLLDTPISSPPGFGSDYGIYHAVYFRKRINKYGARTADNDIIYTNYDIYSTESSKTIFGGDVYNQQTWLKQIYKRTGGTRDGGAAGFNLISQNTFNTQLRAFDPDATNRYAYPINTDDWTVWIVEGYTNPGEPGIVDGDQIFKNTAYSVIKNQQLFPVFDPNQITRSVFPTRIIYSELKPNGSTKDFYRVFPPAQFRDNPNNYGAITHMDIKQGELFTLQELCYTREFLNSTGRLSTIEDGQVIIGDASVLSRPGIRLTQLGSKHKWSYARGLTDSGTDVRCWVNTDFFVVLRAGRDGTVNLTERALMDTFLRDHMRFVKDKFTPADNQGIHATWDDVGKNFMITCRAWIDHEEWSATSSGYKVGEIVSYGSELSIPILYVCIQNIRPEGPNTRPGEPTVQTAIPGSEIGAAYWERKYFSDFNYYSVWTLAFNEARNRFTHFQTFYPKIYANHFDRYFSPSPYDGESNRFFLMRDSEPLVFYDRENEGYSEYVINQDNSVTKKFVSIAFNSYFKPFKVELKTQFISENGIEDRVTTLDRSEFTMRENIAFSTIKNTLDSQGRNNQRTAPMKGLWLRIKTFFKAREYQKINDIFVPVRTGQRNIKNP